jgi:hypothetical protein
MVCPPVTSEAGARRPRSISNFGGLCQTRKTPTLGKLGGMGAGRTLDDCMPTLGRIAGKSVAPSGAKMKIIYSNLF